MVIALASSAQDISLQSSTASFSILPGAPAEFQLTVRNVSSKPLVLVGTTLQSALFPNGLPGGTLQDPNGKTLSCSGMSGGLIVKGNKPPCETPTIVFPAGGSLTLHCGIYSQGSCPLQDVPPGHYTGKVQLVTQACVDGQARTIAQILEIPVTVMEPRGEDAAYLQALNKTVKETPPGFSGTYGGPLKWMEVLDSPRVHSRDIVLQRFPTSTYAGYVLAHHGPALALQSLASLDDVDQTLRQFGYRGGSEENTQAHIKAMQDTMCEYVAHAGPFLKAHPDFFYAPLIRRLYAMSLGLTGHVPEAMAEIQTLSTGTGKEADEAKAYLAAKATK